MKLIALSLYAFPFAAASALLAGCGGSQQPIGAPAAIPQSKGVHTKTYYFTGQQQDFRVPPDVKHVTITAIGAAGSKSARGGLVKATILVMPGESLAVFVGGQPNGMAGGFNGGADGGIGGAQRPLNGYGGGGASDVRQRGNAMNDRVVVAGGGGGNGAHRGGNGGSGGGSPGDRGRPGFCDQRLLGKGCAGGGGGGGSQSQGGAGGKLGEACCSGYLGATGADGGLGGGAGGGGCSGCYGAGGGGGGGGYYGGGGGGSGGSDGPLKGKWAAGGGGGGGGSGFAEASATDVTDISGGGGAGPSRVVISW
jgi:hypothetical protein